MMFVKAFILVSAIAYLVCAEKKPLKERLYKCKLMPLIKHHSILDTFVSSIMPSLPIDYAVPNQYTVDTTLGTGLVPAAVPIAPQQEVQLPSQPEIQLPSQPESQLPSQPEVQLPLQPEVQYRPEQEVQSPIVAPTAPQLEGQPPAQQPVAEEQPLYPPQHAAPQQKVEQNLPTQNVQNYPAQNEGQYYPQQNNGQYYPQQNNGQYYPQQNNGQYYPQQINGQYYPAQNQGLYYQPPNYQGLGTNNMPYNYSVYGQNVLRAVKSLDAQINPSAYGYIQKPYPYNYFPRAYAAPFYYNYMPRAPKTPQALLKVNAKST